MANKKVPCEVFCRVCGYYRPQANMNDGKVSEYKDRTFFNYLISPNRCSFYAERCLSR